MTYLSRLTLPFANLAPIRVSRLMGSDAYEHHRLIWKLFPDSGQGRRDFLFRLDTETRALRGLLLSPRVPIDETGVWHIETKPFTPKLRSGQRLGFSLRANPVVSAKDEHGRNVRHDVVMHAKHQARERHAGAEDSEQERLHRTVREWLTARAARAGFSVDGEGILVERYLRHCLRRVGASRPIRFSSVDVSGVLAVRDPAAFLETLHRGIGPCKGFGCGLLLVRPTLH